jgi:hypothetical protein
MPNKPALNTTPAPSNAMLEAALSLAAKGFPVFRLAYKTKSPLSESHGFYDATTDPTVIIEWFSQGIYNVAIRTGVTMCVLDIDPR